MTNERTCNISKPENRYALIVRYFVDNPDRVAVNRKRLLQVCVESNYYLASISGDIGVSEEDLIKFHKNLLRYS